MDGKIQRTVQTKAVHGKISITIGDGGAWWITSTKTPAMAARRSPLEGPNPATGKTLEKWVTPGWGFYGATSPRRTRGSPSGGHGVKWAGNGRYWMAVPASGRLFLMEGKSGKVVRSIPAPVLPYPWPGDRWRLSVVGGQRFRPDPQG